MQQTILLGVRWPLEEGWKKRAVGSEVSDDAYARFLALKDKHLTSTALSNAATKMLQKKSLKVDPGIKGRARILVSNFTDPRTKSGSHTTTCTAVSCTHPNCQCT